MDASMTPPATPRPAYRDRSGLLLVFGIVEILIGVVCLLFLAAACLLLTAALRGAPAGPEVPALGMWLNVLVYLGAGGFLITMGAGTIRGKRWARALMLLTSWPVFGAFLIGGIAMAVMMPFLLEAMPQTPGQPDVRGVVQVVLFAVLGCLTVIPLSFILFYSRPNVRATFEARDPGPSWVDGRPLPVLGVAGAVALFGLSSLLGLARGAAYGLFGILFTGGPAVVALLANAVLTLWLAVQLYRMTRNGWWANVAYAVLIHVSGWITVRVIGIDRLIAASGVQAEAAQHPEMLDWAARFAGWFTPVSVIVWVVTLVWLRRYYPPGTFARPAARVAPARG